MNVGAALFLGLGCGLLALGLLANVLASRRRPKVTEEQRIEAFRHKEQMKALVEMPGWKLLVAAAEVQVRNRRNDVMMKPAENITAQEFEKGTVQGIELFMKLPEILLENSKAVLEAYDKEQGE